MTAQVLTFTPKPHKNLIKPTKPAKIIPLPFFGFCKTLDDCAMKRYGRAWFNG